MWLLSLFPRLFPTHREGRSMGIPTVSFDVALERLYRLEGGVSDHPHDRGGLTKYGVTHETWRSFNGGTAPNPVTAITLEDARRVYWQMYWEMGGLPRLEGKVPQALLSEVFDGCVNHGVGRGIRLLQEGYNAVRLESARDLAVDGVLGPVTEAAVGTFCHRLEYAESLLAAYRGERYKFFRGIVASNPSQRAFIRGWLRRLI